MVSGGATCGVRSTIESNRSPPEIFPTDATQSQLSNGVLIALNGPLSAEISRMTAQRSCTFLIEKRPLNFQLEVCWALTRKLPCGQPDKETHPKIGRAPWGPAALSGRKAPLPMYVRWYHLRCWPPLTSQTVPPGIGRSAGVGFEKNPQCGRPDPIQIGISQFGADPHSPISCLCAHAARSVSLGVRVCGTVGEI